MNITNIESLVKELVKNFDIASFIYDFMLAYGLPKATITRLRKGDQNLSKDDNEIALKGKLYFRKEFEADLHVTIDNMCSELKYKERFIVATDYKQFLAIDTKTNDRLDVAFEDLGKHYDFFLPWAGQEKSAHYNEQIADMKAADKMAKLFDEIKKDNPDTSDEFIHSLNVFLSRLLFCYFAEDTGIFLENQFTNALDSHTNVDGSDLDIFLVKLFYVFDSSKRDREDLPAYLDAFPYVNGGLFTDKIDLPKFTRKSRAAIVKAGKLDWKDINPDIFGSMIQAVVAKEHRGNMGMHYTSVPNIMKLIEPLFLDDLKEEFNKNIDNPIGLNKLLGRFSSLKIFDPACGSGNFLIIAYKELRKLEIKIIERLLEFKKEMLAFSSSQLELFPKKQLDFVYSYNVELFSRVQLSQFYGIELDDFAHEIARLALWLAEHQMNKVFFDVFGFTSPTLPLKEAGHIWHGNACRLNWEEVCPKVEGAEIYIMGNPPYLGSRKQNQDHKSDLAIVFKNFKKYKDLDYIACWFYCGAQYIKNSNAKLAFVSTNSICQGLQVSLLWPYIFEKDIRINFAHRSFKWKNNAREAAAVIVVIVGLSNLSDCVNPHLYINSYKNNVANINGYLINGDCNIYVSSRTEQISNLGAINHGNMPADGGKFLFSTEEKESLIKKEPKIEKWFKKILSAREYLNGRDRWCLWLDGITNEEINSMQLLKEIIEDVKKIRLSSSRPQLADIPHLFAQITQPENSNCIIIPRVSSERRIYLPIGFIDGSEFKVTDSLFTIATNESYIFGIVSSKMHTVWLKIIGGKMKTDYQYSKNIVYNTFPFPEISKKRKQELTETTMRILEEREKYSDKTLAQLYDPEKMPEGLREAHRLNDEEVERCYRKKPFTSDEERLEYLFKLYEKMIGEESAKELELKAQKKKIKTK